MDLELLKQFLIWIAFSGGSGFVAYLLWEQLEKWFKKVAALPADAEAYITLAVTGVLAVAAYLIMVAMGYTPEPDTAKMWIEAIFAVLGPAVGITKVLHGIKKGKQK